MKLLDRLQRLFTNLITQQTKNIVPVSVPKPAIVIRVEMTTVLTPLSAGRKEVVRLSAVCQIDKNRRGKRS